MADDTILLAVTPKAFGTMTEEERDAFANALAAGIQQLIPLDPGVDDLLDSDEDPLDLLTDEEVRAVYDAWADEAFYIGTLTVPPDGRSLADHRAQARREADEYIAGRIAPPAGKLAVRQHGEIGPVLTRKGQDFTGPKDIS